MICLSKSIDANKQKQGRWVYFGRDKKGLKNKVLKHNQITEEGHFLNDKKNGVWKTYHMKTNKSKSELIYVDGICEGKAKFFNEKGKLINAVLPGALDTAMTRANLSQEQISLLESITPLGSLPNLTDVTGLVAYLCSPQNTGITGQFIAADRGFSNARIL
jgi:hypothetical protein